MDCLSLSEAAAADDRLLVAKIAVLVPKTNQHEHERIWVALLLLTRVTDPDAFRRAMHEKQELCVRLLYPTLLLSDIINKDDTSNNQSGMGPDPLTAHHGKDLDDDEIWYFRCCLTQRLVAQLLYRWTATMATVRAPPPLRANQKDKKDSNDECRAMNALGLALAQCYCATDWKNWTSTKDTAQSTGSETDTTAIGISDFVDEKDISGHHCTETRWKNDIMGARVEILYSLDAWLSLADSAANVDSMLQQFWNASDRQWTTKFETPRPSLTDTTTTTETLPLSSGTVPPQRLMNDTVTTLLDGTTILPISRTNSFAELTDMYHVQWMMLFLQGGQRLIELSALDPPQKNRKSPLPSFFRPALTQWLSTKTTMDSHQKRAWQVESLLAVILGFAQQQETRHIHNKSKASQSVKDISKAPKADCIIVEDVGLTRNVIQCILACIVTTVASEWSRSLRCTAWMCVASLIRAIGWEWLTVSSAENLDSCGNRATSQYVCAIVRFASGEWTLQLDRVLDVPNDTNACEESIQILEACGDVISEVVPFLDRLTEKLNDKKSIVRSSLSAYDVLLIRRSLEEALNASCQYLELSEIRSRRIDEAAIQVVGAMLTEIDPFDSPAEPSSIEEKDDGSHFSLQGLRKALQITSTSNNAQVQSFLLPCIVAIMETVEMNPRHCKLLRMSAILGETLALFLITYFQNATKSNDDATLLACQTIDVWCSMTGRQGPTRKETNQLLDALTGFMTSMIQTQKRAQSSVNVMSAAVGAFISLQGDSPPTIPQMNILKEVLMLRDLQ